MKLLKLLTLLLTFTVLAAANEAITNPFLWEVKKGEQTFYLFGTMHLGDPLSKSYLFAFGVMHFLGKQSIVEHFERQGYSVE